MRITSKGQVTIPVGIREKAGLLPGTEVDFELDGDSVRIVRAKAPKGETPWTAGRPSAAAAAPAVRCRRTRSWRSCAATGGRGLSLR